MQPLRTGLGRTVPELNVDGLGQLHLGTFEKTLFSMVTPQIEEILTERAFDSVLILGIEVRAISMQGPTPSAPNRTVIYFRSLLSVPRLCAPNRVGPPRQRLSRACPGGRRFERKQRRGPYRSRNDAPGWRSDLDQRVLFIRANG